MGTQQEELTVYGLREKIKNQWGQDSVEVKLFDSMTKSIAVAEISPEEKLFLENLASKLKYPYTKRSDNSYAILTETEGMVFYYPKADKLQVKKNNSWKQDAFQYIKKAMT